MRLDAIGDMIIWFDAAKEYKKYFPNTHLVLLCNKISKEISEALPYFDEVICLDTKKFLKSIPYRLKYLAKLKRRKFEKAINPVFSRDFFIQDTLIHNIRAEKKIGYQGNYLNTESTLLGLGKYFIKYANTLKTKSDKWYNQLIENNENVEVEIIRNAHFLRKLFSNNFLSNLPSVPFILPIYPNLPKEYVVLFVGASMRRRLWRTENYQRIIHEINTKNIVVCGGKGEENIWDLIAYKLTTEKNIQNLIGKTTLLELFTIIKNATYIITNETSASHITVAVRTPSVCLLGGTHFGRFQPYQVEEICEEDKKYLPKVVFNKMDCFGCNTHCKYIKDKITIWPCIDGITVEQVIEKVKEIEIENDCNNIV